MYGDRVGPGLLSPSQRSIPTRPQREAWLMPVKSVGTLSAGAWKPRLTAVSPSHSMGPGNDTSTGPGAASCGAPASSTSREPLGPCPSAGKGKPAVGTV